VEGFILDLRNNGGGLVSSSLDISSLWLDAAQQPTIFEVEDRYGSAARQKVVLEGPGPRPTDLPLVVLVNKNSASASEILAGALHDNARAEVVGERTFGKGKIQSVFELGDGSALFVTVAKYRTPSGAEIDKIGVKPDRACSPIAPGGPASVPGIPLGPGADERVLDELESDDCVLTAESMLERRVSV
jgi:carboxyl-terminal processing protease